MGSCPTLSDPMNYIVHQVPLSMECPRQEYWSRLPFPSSGIFPIQGSNPHLPHCRQILYHLSHQGSKPWKRDEGSIKGLVPNTWMSELLSSFRNIFSCSNSFSFLTWSAETNVEIQQKMPKKTLEFMHLPKMHPRSITSVIAPCDLPKVRICCPLCSQSQWES